MNYVKTCPGLLDATGRQLRAPRRVSRVSNEPYSAHKIRCTWAEDTGTAEIVFCYIQHSVAERSALSSEL